MSEQEDTLRHSQRKDSLLGWLSAHKILILLIILTLGLRVAAELTRKMIQLDETAYVRMAQNLNTGLTPYDISGQTATHFSPLFPILIAALQHIVHDYVLTGYIVVALFGSLMLIPTYKLGEKLAGRRVGLMAAALMAVMPLFLEYTSKLYSEGVYIFFLLWTIYFGWEMIEHPRLRYGLLAGLSLGLAYLSNPSSIYYLVAIGLFALAYAALRGQWRAMVRPAVAFAAVFCVFAVPYVLFLHQQLGRWTYTGKAPGDIYAATHNLRINTLDAEKDFLGLTADGTQVRELALGDCPTDDLCEHGDPMTEFIIHPVQAMKILAQQGYITYKEELGQVLPLWLLPLLGLGLFAKGWSRRRLAWSGYFVLMMGPVVIILSMYAHDRFFMPFVPLLAIWMGLGWKGIEEWSKETLLLNTGEKLREAIRPFILAVIGLLVLLPAALLGVANVAKESYPTGYRDAGTWIMNNEGVGFRVMTREYSAAFYADGNSVALPYADYAATTRYARINNVDYLVIQTNEVPGWRPGLTDLLDSDQSKHPDWQLIDVADRGTDQETLVFKLV